MDSLIALVAGKGVEGVISYIAKEIAKGGYEGISKKIGSALKKNLSPDTIAKIKLNISNLSKVKTILDPNQIVDLYSIYYPDAIKFEGNDISNIFDFSPKHILVEGGPGQGKSLFLRHICLTESKANRVIPVLIEFRNLKFEI